MHLYEAWRRNLEDLVIQRGGVVLLHASLFVIGLLFGALALRSLDADTRLELTRQLADSVRVLGQAPAPETGPLVRDALLRQARQVSLMWVLSISLVGAVAVMALPLLRGFISGFAVAYLTAEFGTRGVLLAAAGHLPQTVLEVPGLILAASASVGFALEVATSWRVRRRLSGYYGALAAYSNTLLSAAALLVAAALVEGFISPHLIRLVAGARM
ncbi:stage II sporulation protein M [Symbiobacterium terraclitae]|uniref:stage II sporulation protein M n=1 Tax=Symbiobacterium terraclitae TaxID=557451 RepID=UPI0035B5533E